MGGEHQHTNLDATRVRDLTELTIKSAVYVGAWWV